MTTFDELFAEHNLTPKERKALVMHLATLRAQKTVEALQDCPRASAPSTPPPAVVEAVPLEIDYDALITAAFKRYHYAQGTGPCVAFKRGAEWMRDQVNHGIAPKAAQEKP